MRRDIWTEDRLSLLRTYVENGFSNDHIKFMLNLDDAQLDEGRRRLEETEG